MNNARALLVSLAAAALLLGACTSSPTSPARPDAARLNGGGHGDGSGNVVPTDTTEAAASTLETAATDTTGQVDRGGHGYGSGN